MSQSPLRSQIRELIPHYFIMIVLMIVVLTIVNLVVGPLGTWPSVGIAIVVAVAYPFMLRWLGRAPEAWQ